MAKVPVSNSDKTATLNIQCKRGDSFDRIITFVNDISADTFKMQVRNKKTKAVILDFVMGADISILNSTQVLVSKSGVEMDAVEVVAGVHSYDFQQTFGASGKTKTRFGGDFIINQDITTPSP